MNPNYQKIWQTIKAIPRGKVASYGQIADFAGLPGRARLVGRALRESSAEQQLPWQRVVRSNGELAFDKNSEQALLQKTLLLEEGVVLLGRRLDMKKYGWQPDLGELLWRLKY